MTIEMKALLKLVIKEDILFGSIIALIIFFISPKRFIGKINAAIVPIKGITSLYFSPILASTKFINDV